MARETTDDLKLEFEEGDSVSGSNFANIFDSTFNLEDTTTRVSSGSLNLESGNIIITGSFSTDPLSSIERKNWSAGYLGSDVDISIPPQDFYIGDFRLTTPRTQTTQIDGIYTSHSVAPSAYGATIQLPYGGVSGAKVYVSKIIPKGYEAYDYQVYGGTIANEIQAFSGSIFTSGSAELSPVRTISLGLLAFGDTVIGDGQNYVSISWKPGSNSDKLYGAKIGIRKI